MRAGIQISTILASRRNSGHSLDAIRCASPSTIPVLPTPGSSDEDRIGFALLRKNPRHPENLVLPPDHRLQFSAPRQFGDVPAKKRERRFLHNCSVRPLFEVAYAAAKDSLQS